MINEKLEQVYIKILARLTGDLDNRMLHDPDFGSELPSGCYVVIQVKVLDSDERKIFEVLEHFNEWVRGLAKRQIQPGQPSMVACLTVPYVSTPSSTLLPLEGIIGVDDPRLLIQQRLFDAVPRQFEFQAA